MYGSRQGSDTGIDMVIHALFIIISVILLIPFAAAQMKTEGVQAAERTEVILQFDDAWRSQYYNAIPALEEYGFTATFMPFIIDHWGGLGDDGSRPYMTWDEIIDLQNRGMEIGSQGWSHPANITRLSDDELVREVVYSKDELEKRGLVIQGWTYPNDAWDSRVMAMVREHYEYGVPQSYVYESRPVSGETDMHLLEGTAVTNELLSEFSAYLETVDRENTIIFIYHEIDDRGGRFVTPVGNFREQMKYLHDNGFVGVSFRDYYGLPQAGAPVVPALESYARIVILALVAMLVLYVFYIAGK